MINKPKDTESPFERKGCYDCKHLTAALSWWCGNKNAIKARGTRIPGVIHCPYWDPAWGYIHTEFKTTENGYKGSWLSILLAKFKKKKS